MSYDPQIASRGDASDQSPVDAILDDRIEHLLEYCTKLLGDSGADASVTETALVAAQTILLDPDKLRAWLSALAHADVNSIRRLEPDSYGRMRHHVPTDQGDVASCENEATTESLNSGEIAAAKALSSNPASGASANMSGWKRAVLDLMYEDVLDLVYEYGIRRDDLPTVLGLPPQSAWDLLEAAEVSSAEWPGFASIDGQQPGLGLDESQLYATDKPRLWHTRRHAWSAATLTLSAAAAVAGILYLAAPSLYHTRDTAQPNVTSSREPGSPSGSARHSMSPMHSHSVLRHRRSKSITHPFPSGAHQSFPVRSGSPTPTRSSMHPSPLPTFSHQPSPRPSSSNSPSPTSSPTATSTPSPSPSGSPTAS